jgi:hypothetical protein
MSVQKFRMGCIIHPVIILVVVTALQFNHHFQRRTVEVHDIGTEAVLPEEFHSMELPVAHMSPKDLFGFGLISA